MLSSSYPSLPQPPVLAYPLAQSSLIDKCNQDSTTQVPPQTAWLSFPGPRRRCGLGPQRTFQNYSWWICRASSPWWSHLESGTCSCSCQTKGGSGSECTSRCCSGSLTWPAENERGIGPRWALWRKSCQHFSWWSRRHLSLWHLVRWTGWVRRWRMLARLSTRCHCHSPPAPGS